MPIKKQYPISGTLEWADNNLNIISGCKHGCRYCYAASMSIRFHRKTSETWKNEVINQSKINKSIKKKPGRFMFPSTHDITSENLDYCLPFLGKVLEVGNEVLIVSKPSPDCIREICSEFDVYRNQILFRFTIGSTDNDTLRFWEPFAPSYEERLQSLMHAYLSGFATSISIEPMLSPNVEALINQLRPYVTDAIWLGRGKHMMGRLKMNGYNDPATMDKARKLTTDLSDGFIKELYFAFQHDPQIKWKDSLKKVVGIPMAPEPGRDI